MSRYFFYDLFFSMFVREPSDEIIDSWRKGLAAVCEAQPEGAIGKAASNILDLLQDKDANESVRSEFFRLFWHPEGPAVSPLASTYVDGKPFGPYLVRLRTFLEKTPFRKIGNYMETEDSLAFHLDLMRAMIKEENESDSPQEKEKWQDLQRELMNEYMSEWIDLPFAQLEQRDTEPFYQRVAILARLYFQVEKDFLLIPSH
jgi:TorA maturation chaperone TorD